MNNKIFDNVNGYKLDEEQRNAILSNAKYNMIIAGAGSGKTLTMIGKILYLINIKNIKPEEILCISFTNEAVNSLKNKINNPKVKVFTFHRLAIYLLNQTDTYYEFAPSDFLSKTIDKFFLQEPLSTFLKTQIKKSFKLFLITKDLTKHKNYQEIKKTIITFINLYYANNLSFENLKTFLNQKKSPLLFLIYAIIHFYEKEKIQNHYLDFDDLIKEATKLCKQNLAFKEIIIDEFQDTSLLRLDLIKEIIKNSNANLTVVGDDFQSIYKFSGCNLDIFLNFQNYFPNTKIHKIQNTYRNSNELIKIAGDFVMKNKIQIHKDLKSNIHLENPIKLIYFFDRYKTILKTIKAIKNGEILILGRNNFDIYKYIPKDKITWLKDGYFKLENYNYNLRYLTIHKSKGLECDNVILINLENYENGFPSQKKNHQILNFINQKENFLYEEERRLFYVALTRTKNYCYILIPYFNPSVFIKELKKAITRL